MAHKIDFNWHLLYECNYRCPYCFYFGSWEKLPKLKKEISIEDWITAWHRIYERYGRSHIGMTGGEPLIYPSFIELVKALSKEHELSFVSNLSCNLNTLKKLANYITTMNLSFHPLFADFNDFFKKVLFLKEKGIPLRIFYVTYPPQFKQMMYFKEKFQEEGFRFMPLPFRGCHKGVTYPLGYTGEEKTAMTDFTESLKDEDKELIKAQVELKSTRGRLCQAGQLYAHIDMYGTVYRCSGSTPNNKPLGSLFDEGFRLLDSPQPCEVENCPCESQWLVKTN